MDGERDWNAGLVKVLTVVRCSGFHIVHREVKWGVKPLGDLMQLAFAARSSIGCLSAPRIFPSANREDAIRATSREPCPSGLARSAVGRALVAGGSRLTQASAVFHVKHSAGYASVQSMIVTKLEAG